jgi:UDP-N-acetylmuramoyl-L-alanyl-D-glutamate--2,6-diaminopimelate ligase
MIAGSVTRTGSSCFEGVAARSGLEYFVEAEDIRASTQGIAFTAKSSWGEARIESTLLGRFNISNLLGVLATMMVSGVPFAQATGALALFRCLAAGTHGGVGDPGIVDAHSPDAFQEVARSQGVCGAGNGRPGVRRRPRPRQAPAHGRDRLAPCRPHHRHQRQPTRRGSERNHFRDCGWNHVSYEVIADRRAAIAAAVASARTGDVVLIAGKGHETFQEVGGKKLPFSDSLEARVALGHWES